MPLAPAAMRAPGGFTWWYLDALDGEGNGVVLIWSWGLPFLPGWTAAQRHAPLPAQEAPSLNVVIYRRGRPDFYLLQPWPAASASWDQESGVLTMGASRLHAPPAQAGEPATVTVSLDCPVSGGAGRLQGTIRVQGMVRQPVAAPGPPSAVAHDWSPVMPGARAEVDLTCADRRWRMTDLPAYHDRNAACCPIDRMGIRRWTWGRVSDAAGASRIWYCVEPEVEGQAPVWWGLEVEPDGRTVCRLLDAPRHRGWRWDRFGVAIPGHTRLQVQGTPWLTVRHVGTLDRGFFYVRTRARATGPGLTAADLPAITEWVLPQRVDRPWHLPLVRMAVDQAATGAPSSRFVGLFTGPRGGRLGRWWSGAGASAPPSLGVEVHP
jgi:hypothetical protein